jgi:hypothetical protein
MTTDAIDLTGTDAVTVAGIFVTSSVNAMLYEVSASSTTTDGGLGLYRGAGNVLSPSVTGDVGANQKSAAASTLAIHTTVTTFDFSQPGADELVLWMDGTVQALPTQVLPVLPALPENNTGDFKNLALNIGSRNNGASRPSNAGMYQLCLFDRALSDDDKAAVTVGLNKLHGFGNMDFRYTAQQRSAAFYSEPGAGVVTVIGAGETTATAVINLPSPWNFDGQIYTQVTVTANGMMYFGNVLSPPTDKAAFGLAGTPPGVAIWWDNLKTADVGGSVRFYQSPTASPSLQWTISWTCYANSAQTAANNDTIEFQARFLQQQQLFIQYKAFVTTGTPDRTGYGAVLGLQGISAGTQPRYWNMLMPDGAPMPASLPVGLTSTTTTPAWPFASTMDASSVPRADLIVRDGTGNVDWPGTTFSRAQDTAYRISLFTRQS